MNNAVTVTASGRVVKKRFTSLDDDPEQEVTDVVRALHGLFHCLASQKRFLFQVQ